MNNGNYLEQLWKKREMQLQNKRKMLKVLILIGIALMIISIFLPVSQLTPFMKEQWKYTEYIDFSGKEIKTETFESITPIDALRIYDKITNNYDFGYHWLLAADIILLVITLMLIAILTLKKPGAVLIILSIVAMFEYLFIWSISGGDMFFKYAERMFEAGLSPIFGFGGVAIIFISSIIIPSCVSSNR